MKTIVCPTDFSPNSGKAIDYAVEIAKKTGASLTLVHAFEAPMRAPGVIVAAQPGLDKDARTKLEAARDEIKKGTNLEVVIVARQGDPVKVILDTAEDVWADMIVMGTLGVTNLGDMVFGTNAAEVIRKANVPVLAIPYDFEFDGVLDRIIFATETLREDELGFQQLVDFARIFDAEIEVLHVLEGDEEINEKDEEELEKIYREELNYEKIDFDVKKSDEPMDGIVEFFKEKPGDMVAMITRKRNIIARILDPSLARKLASMGAVPIMVFHPSDIPD